MPVALLISSEILSFFSLQVMHVRPFGTFSKFTNLSFTVGLTELKTCYKDKTHRLLASQHLR